MVARGVMGFTKLFGLVWVGLNGDYPLLLDRGSSSQGSRYEWARLHSFGNNGKIDNIGDHSRVVLEQVLIFMIKFILIHLTLKINRHF